MSMSIPLVWNEVIWAAEWGGYLGHSLTGHAVVDGGVLSNFPIELFISDEPQVTKLMGPKQDAAVLGLLIDESLPVPPVARKRGILVDVKVKPGELRTVQRITRLIDTMTGAHDKMVIEEFNDLVARLPAAGYSTTEFDMSDERREALVKAGRDAMAAFFDKRPARRVTTRGPRAPGAKGVKPIADRIATRLLGR
jgi:NTE family protein